MTRMDKKFAVIIPAYHPSLHLPNYIRSLHKKGAAHVIVVNDGNNSSYKLLFDEIKEMENVHVLTHKRNKGKGAALKTAFRYFLETMPDCAGVVTADADEQHAVEDVIRLGEKLVETNAEVLLGMRTFQVGKVPIRSFIGNTITSFAFKLLFGPFIRDTQTGLRGFNSESLTWIQKLRGDKFDYEINMLIHAAKRKIEMETIDIETIYHENHFSNYQSYSDSVLIIQHIWKGFFSNKTSYAAIEVEE